MCSHQETAAERHFDNPALQICGGWGKLPTTSCSDANQIKTQPIVENTEKTKPPASIDAHRVLFFTGDMRLLRWAKLKPAQFMILACIKAHQNRFTGESEAGAKRLCQVSGIGRTTVFKSLKVLEEKGWIEIANPTREEQANTYRLFDTIAIVVNRVRVGVVRATFTPQDQEAQLDALRIRLAVAYKTATQDGAKVSIAVELMTELQALAGSPEGNFIHGFAVREGNSTKTSIVRITAFAQNAPREPEVQKDMLASARKHLVSALDTICPVKPLPVQVALPTVAEVEDITNGLEVEIAV